MKRKKVEHYLFEFLVYFEFIRLNWLINEKVIFAIWFRTERLLKYWEMRKLSNFLVCYERKKKPENWRPN